MNTQPEGVVSETESYGMQSKSLILQFNKIAPISPKGRNHHYKSHQRAKNALEILTMTPHPDVIIMCLKRKRGQRVKWKRGPICCMWLRVHMFALAVLSIAYLSAFNQGRAVKPFK